MHETVSPLSSLATAALIVAIGALRPGPTLAQPQPNDSKPMVITTDTPAYCLHLVNRVGDLIRLSATPVAPDVTGLATEGKRMCAIGQTRSGIMRLRSALMIMEQRNGGAYR